MFLRIAFLLLGIVVALLLSPQLGSETYQNGAFVVAPPEWVRSQILDYNFVQGLQSEGKSGSLRPMHVQRGSQVAPASEAKAGEYVELVNRTGGIQTAKVVSNAAEYFVYREDFAWGQRIVHNVSWELADPKVWKAYPAGSTVLVHARKWRGSPLLLFLRRSAPGAQVWLGEGLPMPAELGGDGGIEGVRLALQQAWEVEMIKAI